MKVFCNCICFLLYYLPDRSNHSSAMCVLGFLSCFFRPAAQCFVCLGCVVLSRSSFPSLLHVFGLLLVCCCCSLSSDCKAKISPWLLVFPVMLVGGVSATRTLVHVKDRPLQPQSECRLMSFSYICSSPPPAAHQY